MVARDGGPSARGCLFPCKAECKPSCSPDEEVDESFFAVKASSCVPVRTVQDQMLQMCADLAKKFRNRPTLPPHPLDHDKSWTDNIGGAFASLLLCLPGLLMAWRHP